ncbi:hypothetical protein [Aneurinibacillus migulanus]|uniref:hypothetical protein n=1 Tax=Aneurinibacillus migulanus TaxID=47500 RepID=UPI00209EB5A8|nr:hypothetical protein [Aneurinibacillus migulanus]MCP1355074.1 hypothetical protein [Aneurinibacillus migulanus]
MADKSELSMKVDIDVSGAITGLKAVQREAKEAICLLKELEGQQVKNKEQAINNFVVHVMGDDIKKMSKELADKLRESGCDI